MSGPTPIELTVPGDKSITHRALLLAALAHRESRIRGLLDAADTRAMAAAIRALGIETDAYDGGSARVGGGGLHGFRAPADTVDCGNSGTAARLLLGALAGCELEAVVTGDASLRARPMRRVTDPLTAVGAEFRELGEPDRLPIRVRGTRGLRPIDMRNERSSAQVKTAMLLAGLTAGVEVRVTERGRPRDHTERMMSAMGARVRTAPAEDGHVVHLEPPTRLEPLDLVVPGDISSAAFFLTLGALRHPIRVAGVGINPTRTGALDVMRRMGARVEVEETGQEAGEPVGVVTVSPDRLTGTTVAAEEVPILLDEIPVLAILAVRSEGETRFEGVAELRVKETDRIAALASNLRALGVDVDDGPDHLAVRGTDRDLAGTVNAFGDHRIAMAFGVLGALGGGIEVRGGEVVAISYPAFWTELQRVMAEAGAA